MSFELLPYHVSYATDAYLSVYKASNMGNHLLLNLLQVHSITCSNILKE